MSPTNEPLQSGAPDFIIDKLYQDSKENQDLREIIKNALESGATKVQIAPEWQAVSASRVWRRCIADNGVGMNPEELHKYPTVVFQSGKTLGINHGVGLRSSTLPWNHAGLLILSKTAAEEGHGIMLFMDPQTRRYSAKTYLLNDGTYGSVVPFSEKPEWAAMAPPVMAKHGTAVICYGMTGKEDTYFGPTGKPPARGLKYIHLYLNEKMWDLSSVEVKAFAFHTTDRASWPTSPTETVSVGGTRKRVTQNRIIKGASHYIFDAAGRNAEKPSNGTVQLPSGAKVHWSYRKTPAKVHAYGPEQGFIAALNQQELFAHRSSTLDYMKFGIGYPTIAKRTFLIVEPPLRNKTDGTLTQDVVRGSLRYATPTGGVSNLTWGKWAAEFSDLLPDVIVQALLEEMATDTNLFASDSKFLKEIIDRSKDLRSYIGAVKGGPDVDATNNSRKKNKKKPSGKGGGQSKRPRGPTYLGAANIKLLSSHEELAAQEMDQHTAAQLKPGSTKMGAVLYLNTTFFTLKKVREDLIMSARRKPSVSMRRTMEIYINTTVGYLLLDHVYQSEQFTRMGVSQAVVREMYHSPEHLTGHCFFKVSDLNFIGNCFRNKFGAAY